MDDKPIIKFTHIEATLKRLGISFGEAKPWKDIHGDVDNDWFRTGKLQVTEKGIYIIDDEGEKHQVYLYKRDFYIHYNGQIKYPKYHVCKCQTIQTLMEQRNEEYRFANTDAVEVRDKGMGYRKTIVRNLGLCGNCASMMRMADISSAEFADLLKKAEERQQAKRPKADTRVDVNGYPANWNEISLNYRIRKQYTCEKCKVKVSPWDTTFMEVHHKNGDKTNCEDSNLQCLCIKCHSEVNPAHVRNYATPGKQMLIKQFMEKYKDKRIPKLKTIFRPSNPLDDLPF